MLAKYISLNIYACQYNLLLKLLSLYLKLKETIRCKENPTNCNVYINLTQPMFGSCFTSCLVEGACLNYVNCVCVCVCVCIVVSLQSQEILNRPVFVLDILKCLRILKINKNFEKILNKFWKFLKLLKILNRFWTLLKIAENSEQILNITENSEQILNIIFLLKSICFTSFSLDFLTCQRYVTYKF